VSVERRFFVKICGLRDAASAQVAVDAGADALGFILAPARRQISVENVADILGSLDRSSNHPAAVGVTVNASIEDIQRAVQVGGVEAIQLSGDETPDMLQAIDVPVFKALRFPPGMEFEDATREVDRWFSAATPAARVIVEGHAPGSYGGTGASADPELVEKIALRYPVVLAGGLTPDNVAGAIANARPWGVDVSSGVELDGRKDPAKIMAFVQQARAAAAGLS
jgi:phosphoribosylanthranilate isomerase